MMSTGAALSFSEKERMVDQFTTLESSMLNYPVGQKEFKGLFAHAWDTSIDHFQYRIRKTITLKRKQNHPADFQYPPRSLPPHYRLQSPAIPRSLRFQPNAPSTLVQTTPGPRQCLQRTPTTVPWVRTLVGRFSNTMAVSNPDGSHSAQKRASESFKTGLKTFQLVCGDNCFKEEDLLDALSPAGHSLYRDSWITKWKRRAEVWKRAQRILNAGRYTGK